jgi:hypothetical protein
MRQVRVYGIDIQDVHVRKVIGALNKTGTPAALAAASQLSRALSRMDTAGQLTPAMRDAILEVLPAAPQPGLTALHRALLQDHVARTDSP